ncbi:20S proteasome subunit alpha 6 [Microbotryum lychnidis-dioicae p1A1 Lamole]|uniref:20S proteasome subunit alpha 6 n=1 Tax=Microbotryum lychnidis-dioicae (strain p1A1 Lamole / MvSl-1064) TaxID=683840 RepID=U5HIA6_USTV1|nr:20S proteasome subunit alpha 6 [Microbotryum lychnidis-dioicae p1A1 Lamole]|eukprot:KDE02680.1 20S proteasome subunit alpha 6 [Microbotryum lychnidis-dioicae p1A1 Lamole]
MHRNSYDSDNTTLSPAGRLHQVEYALEAVKQGSASVGLRSKTHVILLALKRSTGELASYQKKLIRIDDHIGVAIAGLTSDARVLSNFMRTQAMSSRMLYNRPMPVNRIVNAIADKAQVNTQHYGKRPYGVGFLVAGYDSTGSHLYEFSPTGNCFEYFAMSIGARSQSAKTYLEAHYDEFPDCDLPSLIKHGLHALRDTLQQDKELSPLNTSIGIVGVSSSSSITTESHVAPVAPIGSESDTTSVPKGFQEFRIIEGDDLKPYLESMDPKESLNADTLPSSSATATATTATGPVSSEGPTTATGTEAAAGGEAMETD